MCAGSSIMVLWKSAGRFLSSSAEPSLSFQVTGLYRNTSFSGSTVLSQLMGLLGPGQEIEQACKM